MIACSVFCVLLSTPLICKAEQTKLTRMEVVDSADYYSRTKQWEDAERCTILALKAEPARHDNWLLWSNLGEIRMRMANPSGAIEAYNIGLTQNPEYTGMLCGRASANITVGEIANALSDLNNVLKKDSLNEWSLATRAAIMTGYDKMKEAERDYDVLYRHYPKNPSGALGLGRVMAATGQYDRAIEFFNEAIRLDPDETTWIYKITTLISADRLAEATDAVREAMNILPRAGNLFLMRAWIHKLSYQNQDAELDLNRAKEFNADQSLIDSIFPASEKK